MSYRSHAQRPRETSDRNQTVGTAVLLVGFLAALAAIVIAHQSPANAYELSLYTGTPTAFWGAVAVAFACSLAVSFFPPTPAHRLAGLLLGGEAFVAVAGIPLLRDYAFLGAGDPLTHLGWTKTIVAGDLALTDLIYPGTHTVAIFISQLFGLGLRQSMLLATGVFVLAFVVFVPVVVYAATGDRGVATVGAFSAMMLLPINNISAHLTVFPSTLAVFFLPLVLVLLVVYLAETDASSRVTPVGALLALATFSLVLVHPQQATNLLVVYATVVGVLLVKRRYGDDVQARVPVGQFAFLGTILFAWGLSHERITNAVGAYSGRVVGVFAGASGDGGALAHQTSSLAAIGVSPVEIGAKLFAVSFVYLAVTGVVLVAAARRRTGDSDDRVATLPLLGVTMFPLGVIMVLYVLGGIGTIYFRHLAFIMVVATVVGAVGVGRVFGRLQGAGTARRVGSLLVIVALAVMLCLSLATAFSSPFIHKTSGHVTQAQFSGHETAFTHESEDIGYVGIRTGPARFRDAVAGVLEPDPWNPAGQHSVPFGALDRNLAGLYDTPRYLVVTDADVQREVIAFEEYRYSRAGFRSLDAQENVNRVITNGDFRLYYVGE
ncbi:DUF6541 family protein [Halobacterium zhouii]|uniref:DUF6541 family protein n=1 Tax=Halobacterium zhouii TaxID=2902624 RepID=UPI001E61751E|nr:DUF6541 family protein [Halobacterium zhouii]